MPKIAILLFDGCHGAGVTAPADIFNVVNTMWQHQSKEKKPLLEWQLLSLHGNSVETAGGIKLEADSDLSETPYDGIIIPSLFYPGKQRFQKRLAELSALNDWLIKQHQLGAWIGASCTSVFLLAKSGLLDNREATATWWLSRHFAQHYPKVKLNDSQLLVESGQIITAGTGMAHNHLSMKLAEKFVGADLARHCGRLLLIGGQMQNQIAFSGPGLFDEFDDEVVRKAQLLMQNHLREPFSLDVLSETLAVSPRTLIRRFKQATGEPPLSFFQKLRIEAAKRLLELSPCPLSEVVENVGYSDTSSFRRLFIRHTGIPPMEYRRQFGNQYALAN